MSLVLALKNWPAADRTMWDALKNRSRTWFSA